MSADALAVNPKQRKILPWLAYPGVMLIGFSSYLTAVSLGLGLQLASYATAILAGALIMLLEYVCPHYNEWQGRVDDVRVDILFMLAVQIAFPTLLAVTVSVAAVNFLSDAGLRPVSLWPHHWPVAIQVALMLLSADFLRYWLHVAAHTYEPLWRLHAVHHSVNKLYWLNVGRFHPVEKGLQYLLDAFPFVLLQVGPDILALYFVFYSINGFFQHSNVELRFGWLNYVISSAELHRWHHSRTPGESNSNYGNNLIVWDVLFGSRFLPDDRNVDDLGLSNSNYPMIFLSQMKTPFIKGIEDTDSEILSWREVALNFLLWLRMFRLRLTLWRRFLKATREPRQTQMRLLRQILTTNQSTQFGHDHRFAEISSYEDFCNTVPVQTYEMLRPYIDRQMEDGSAQLSAEAPVMYARTSGTSGAAKHVPILQRTLVQHRRAQSLFSVAQFAAVPAAYYGRALGIVSPAIEGRLGNGMPYGSASGHAYKNMPGPARAKYVIPWQVFEVEDYDLKYLLILRLAMTVKNITHLASANPSTFLKLLELAHQNRDQLLADIELQTFGRMAELPQTVADAIVNRLRCGESRRRELQTIMRSENFDLGDLWPYLRLVTTWTGGSCGIALAALRRYLPADVRIADPGYLASEFRGSITIDTETNASVPTLTENFFEFVEKYSWERGDQDFLTLDQLTNDTQYYVFATTQSGLYRYCIDDIIRTTGFIHRTPTIAFVQKGRGITSITGEKLSESQVVTAVQETLANQSVSATFFLVLADVEAARYRLLLECDVLSDLSAFTSAVETALGLANIEYKEKRASGRLSALECHLMRKGFFESYKRHALADGQREGQYKVLALQYEADFEFDWDSWIDNLE
jgi:sterol desaturase/sphingolipid hydroxylase (fatty acid hydroxylase superfamily)